MSNPTATPTGTQWFAVHTLSGQENKVLENIKMVLGECGSRMEDVVKVVVYLTDLNDFAAFNEVYKQYFKEPYPVRTLVGAKLLFTFNVEIDVTARIG